MCSAVSLDRAAPSGAGKRNRTVYASTISSRDPGLNVKYSTACGWRARIFSSQLSLTISASKTSPLWKVTPLAQGHVQGMVFEPAPPGGQAWHQLPVLVEFDQVLEDVEGNPDPIVRGLIHNP